MDEEQENTYKSERTPRYSAKDVANFRAKYNKALFSDDFGNAKS